MYAIHTVVQYTKCNKTNNKLQISSHCNGYTYTSHETVHKYIATPEIFDKQIPFDIYAI